MNKYLHSVKDWLRTIRGDTCSSSGYMGDVISQAVRQSPKKFGHTLRVKKKKTVL